MLLLLIAVVKMVIFLASCFSIPFHYHVIKYKSLVYIFIFTFF